MCGLCSVEYVHVTQPYNRLYVSGLYSVEYVLVTQLYKRPHMCVRYVM